MSAAVGGYRVVVRLPGALPAFAWAGLARLGYGVLPLALLLLLSARRGSFAEAAAATTAYGLTAALLGPARARAADRFGAARALVVLGALLVAGCALVVVSSRAPLPLLVLVAAAAGAVPPPVGPLMRAVWRRLAGGDEDVVRAAYSLDAVAEEVLFVAGPLVGGLLVAGIGAGAAVVTTGGALLVAAAGMGMCRVVGAAAPAPSGASGDGACRTARFVVGLAPVTGLGLLLGGVDVAAVAAVLPVAGERAGGWPAAAVSAGSLVGGLVYGRRRWPGGADVQAFVLTVAACGGVAVAAWVVLASPGTLVLLLVVLAFAGLAMSPGIVVAYLLADQRAAGGGAGATAWVNAGFNVGAAGGGLVGGVLTDAAGPGLAMLAAAGIALVVAASGVVTVPSEAPVSPMNGSAP